MRTSVQFLDQVFPDSRVASVQATLQQDLSGRSLVPDSAVVTLSTEERENPFPFVPFLTRRAYPFYTSEGYAFVVDNEGASPETTPEIGAWSQVNALTILRGGSAVKSFFPQGVRRLSSEHTAVQLTSALGLLAQFGHRGGIYAGTVAQGNVTAGNLIRKICGYVNGQPAAGVVVSVAETFEDVLLYGWLPYVTPSGVAGSQKGSAKDNLLQVCFALNAFVRALPDGTLRVDNLSTTAVSTLGRDRVYREGASVEELPPVTSVTVLEHAYAPGTESKKLFEGTTAAGQIIVFSEPCSSLFASGFSITESGANYAVVSAGNGILTGVPYIHTTREVRRTVSNSDTENEMRIESATLVSAENSGVVANRLQAYYSCRKYISCDAVLSIEDAGDVVNVWDPIDKQLRQACLESIAPMIFSRTLKGHIAALVGFLPWQTVNYNTVHQVLTGSGNFPVPAGVYELEIVCIGKGSNGVPGLPGNSVSSSGDIIVRHQYYSQNNATSMSKSFSSSASGSSYGKGGEGGRGGDGGKIFRASLAVTPGSLIAYSTTGKNSTFGTLSSASGESAAAGYYDPFDQKTYGKAGAAGASGGNGGSGGNAGESRGGASGGAGDSTGTVTRTLTTSVSGDSTGNAMTATLGVGTTGGGGAGGNSGIRNGTAGGDAAWTGEYADPWYISLSSGTRSEARAYLYGFTPGNGGDGANGADAANYGDGGNGGGGGGGAGAAASRNVNASVSMARSPAGSLILDAYWSVGSVSASGGQPGQGGLGKSGCVIVIYRAPSA